MAYIGNEPVIGQWRKLTDISSGFNGVTTTFTLSVPPGTSQYYVTPGSASQLLISLGGIIQEPDVDYTVSLSTITFTTPPSLGLNFFGILCGDALNAGVPSDGTIIDAKVASNAAINSTKLKFNQSGAGAVERTVDNKLKDIVSVKDFGAVGNGVADDTAAIQAAIDAAAVIVTDGTGDIDQVSAAVHFPSGKYRTTSAIQLKNCVSLQGDGSGSTWILVDHAGNGFYSASGSYYANIHITGIHLESGGSAQDGFVIEGQIRNCYYHDVGCRGFRYSFNLTNTWTAKFEQCYSYNCTSHYYCTTGTGGVHIYGGRYDVASGHGIYVDSAAAELIVNDAAVQFGNRAAVHVKNAYTVELNQCFFEGNCIGSAADYYIYIANDNPPSGTLTSASVTNCVMNNLSDPNRDGLGVLYVTNYRRFTYRERWTRNNVSTIPIIGTGVSTLDSRLNVAASRSSLLPEVAVGSQTNAIVHQLARPIGIFGQDMADTSFAPTTRAALNVGFNSIGVALGTYNSVGSIAAYGASNRLNLNPDRGDVYIGNSSGRVEADSNEYVGRLRPVTQVTSSSISPNATTGQVFINTSGGGRIITLTNITHVAGRTVCITKSTSDSNALTVVPGSGLINGAANWTSTAAYASVTLISDGTNWFVQT